MGGYSPIGLGGRSRYPIGIYGAKVGIPAGSALVVGAAVVGAAVVGGGAVVGGSVGAAVVCGGCVRLVFFYADKYRYTV